ncbi:MAG: ketopantoate reductase family protein [Anaerolineales bacterium]|nr:ketopantoate reductase family protein [Anaerolineales bacterium]
MGFRFLIYGAGAIGTYIGGSLSLQGHQVVFLERDQDLKALQSRGLRMDIDGTQYQIPSPTCISSLDEIKESKFDLIILALKTYHLVDILPDLKRLRKYLPPILCLQNGVESEKILADHIGEDLVIPGTVTSAVERKGKGDITVRRLRGMAAADNHPISREILPIFNQAGLNLKLYAQPESLKWSKLLTNLMGNASSAILNLTPAQIYSDPDLFDLEHKQLRETLKVMSRMGIPPVNLPGVPVKLLALVVKYLPRQLSRPIFLKAIGGGRGGKMPSFHIDLYNGRGKSEVDQLNGAVVRAGKKIDVPTPVNQLFTRVLCSLILGEEPIKKYANKPEVLLALLPND